MVTRKTPHRTDVLDAAHRHGWSHEALVADESNLIRDLFTSEIGIVRTVWIRTPWSSEGRWAGAVFSDRRARADKNVWTLAGKNSLLELLASASSPGGDGRIADSDRARP
jgi:hypothetical protein